MPLEKSRFASHEIGFFFCLISLERETEIFDRIPRGHERNLRGKIAVLNRIIRHIAKFDRFSPFPPSAFRIQTRRFNQHRRSKICK